METEMELKHLKIRTARSTDEIVERTASLGGEALSEILSPRPGIPFVAEEPLADPFGDLLEEETIPSAAKRRAADDDDDAEEEDEDDEEDEEEEEAAEEEADEDEDEDEDEEDDDED